MPKTKIFFLIILSYSLSSCSQPSVQRGGEHDPAVGITGEVHRPLMGQSRHGPDQTTAPLELLESLPDKSEHWLPDEAPANSYTREGDELHNTAGQWYLEGEDERERVTKLEKGQL